MQAGFYKGVQSAGAAVSWALDGGGTPGATQMWVNIAIFLLSIIFTTIAITRYVGGHHAAGDETLAKANAGVMGAASKTSDPLLTKNDDEGCNA